MSDTMLADALRTLFAEVLASGMPAKVSDVNSLPLGHPDPIARKIIRNRIRNFTYGVAERRAAGESLPRMHARVEAATQKIITQDGNGSE